MDESRMAAASRVFAVVVSYRPELLRFSQLVDELLRQCETVLVVDNNLANDLGVEAELVKNPAFGDRLRLARCGDNIGIGAALNIGIEAATAEGAEFVLLSDQDSLPAPDMVRQLVNTYQSLDRSGVEVGSVMPCYVDEITRQAFGFQVKQPGRIFYSVCAAEEARPWVETLSGITSGSLYRIGVFARVGLMREDYFIDYVDTEWFHRARSHGLHLFGTGDAVLYQRLGDDTFPVWYLRWRPFTQYSPVRLYYRFRNFVAMYREPTVPLSWKIRAGWYWLGNLYAYLLFAPTRAKNVSHIFRGLYDGLRRRMGRYDG